MFLFNVEGVLCLWRECIVCGGGVPCVWRGCVVCVEIVVLFVEWWGCFCVEEVFCVLRGCLVYGWGRVVCGGGVLCVCVEGWYLVLSLTEDKMDLRPY